ncbi:DsrE family protein [Halobaculum marinum]|uniref:DsrE family protein n=1 Tax=Halobaculum marinum TaxID=3031996 RepID=A0ABD5WSS9_9EURY|nr:DsrE family protein [Halobaculum sp. DT55]
MAKAAFVILAGTEGHEGLGRVVNALEGAREFVENDDEVEVIFDGAGTQWIAELPDEDHDYHDLFAAVEDEVSVCDYCATAFDVDEAVDDAGVARLADFDGHPSVHSLVDDDYQVLTF